MKESITKKVSSPVMASKGDVFVVIQERDGDIYVTCPFQSCRLGFVDILDKLLLKSFNVGVVLYSKVDEYLTVIQIGEDYSIDLESAITVVQTALDDFPCKHVYMNDNQKNFMVSFKKHLEDSNLVHCIP